MPLKIPACQLGLGKQAWGLRGCTQVSSCWVTSLAIHRGVRVSSGSRASPAAPGSPKPRVSAAQQLLCGASCIITPIPLLVPEGIGNCSLASIWRSSWTWHAKGKNSNGAKIKISRQDNFYARKCYQPKSHRISLSSNLIIQSPFQRCSISPWRRKGLVTGSPVGKGMSVWFLLPSPPNWNSVPLLHEQLFGPSDHPSHQLFSQFQPHTPHVWWGPWGPRWLCLSRAKHLNPGLALLPPPSAASGNGLGDPNPRGSQPQRNPALAGCEPEQCTPTCFSWARGKACPIHAVLLKANCSNLSWVISENTPYNRKEQSVRKNNQMFSRKGWQDPFLFQEAALLSA